MDQAKLTRRQKQYLNAALELQQENGDKPFHYSALAERLAVSKNTAYSMLKSLERKGCVRCYYQLPDVRIGRTTVLFETTQVGRQILGIMV